MRYKKIAGWIFAVCLVFHVSVSQACPKKDCVRIGSWNIEWFGSDKRNQPVDAKTIKAITHLIADELSIDVIVLEEINTSLTGKVRGETYSRAPWQQLRSALQTKGYQIQEGASGHAQHIVMAWRAPAVAVQKPQDVDIPADYKINKFCRSSSLRKPLASLFRAGEFSFWVVGVHLKANMGPAACTSAIRSEQSDQLIRALKPMSKREKNIILAGDFNASSRHESLQSLHKADFHALTEKQFLSPKSNTHSYHSAGSKNDNRGSLVDHIMVSQPMTKEWLPLSTEIYKPQQAKVFAQKFSDHLPVWADFSTKKSINKTFPPSQPAKKKPRERGIPGHALKPKKRINPELLLLEPHLMLRLPVLL